MHYVNDSCFNTHSILQAEAAQLNKELAETAAKHKREQEVRIYCIGLKNILRKYLILLFPP